jgi:hypothetical protein
MSLRTTKARARELGADVAPEEEPRVVSEADLRRGTIIPGLSQLPCRHPRGFRFMRKGGFQGVLAVDIFYCPHCDTRALIDDSGNVVKVMEGKGWA